MVSGMPANGLPRVSSSTLDVTVTFLNTTALCPGFVGMKLKNENDNEIAAVQENRLDTYWTGGLDSANLVSLRTARPEAICPRRQYDTLAHH